MNGLLNTELWCLAAESPWEEGEDKEEEEEEEEGEEEGEGCACEFSLSFEGGKKPVSSSSWHDLGYHR